MQQESFTYLAIWGAISLQGPHHVANQSTTTTGFLARVSLKPAALEGARNTWSASWNPHRKLNMRLQLQVQLPDVRVRGARLATVGCLLLPAGSRDDNSRLNVVDSHLGQCGVE